MNQKYQVLYKAVVYVQKLLLCLLPLRLSALFNDAANMLIYSERKTWIDSKACFLPLSIIQVMNQNLTDVRISHRQIVILSD